MREKQGRFTDLLTLLVFALFALCVLGVLLTGAGVYQRLAARGEQRYVQSTAAAYIATRVRQAQRVTVEAFEGCEALVLEENLDGECYVTRVYVYEGYLRELYSAWDATLHPEDGEKLLPETNLELSLDKGLLTVRAGNQTRLLSIRTGKEALP